MTGLLEIRERLRNFYGKYEIYVVTGVKFVLGLVTFFLINNQMGYMERLDHPALALLLALLWDDLATFISFGNGSFCAGIIFVFAAAFYVQ